MATQSAVSWTYDGGRYEREGTWQRASDERAEVKTAAVTVKALTAAVSRGGLGTVRRVSDGAPRWPIGRRVAEA